MFAEWATGCTTERLEIESGLPGLSLAAFTATDVLINTRTGNDTVLSKYKLDLCVNTVKKKVLA